MYWLLVFVGLLFFSVVERVRRKKARLLLGQKELPMEPKTSPLATALGELMAIAGGIYLTLLVTTSFLEVQLPARVSVGPVTVEPLAGFALLLAILQPWLLRFLPHQQ